MEYNSSFRVKGSRSTTTTMYRCNIPPILRTLSFSHSVRQRAATLGVSDYSYSHRSNIKMRTLATYLRELEKQKQGVGSNNNTATVKLDWSGSDTPCWFDLKPNSSAAVGAGANSDQWSFDVSQRAATTVGLESATPTSGSTSAGTTTSVADSSTTSTSNPTQSSNPGALSTGAQAGIGVSVGILGITLGAAAAMIYMRRRGLNKRTQTAAATEAGPTVHQVCHTSNSVSKHGSDTRFLDKTPIAEAEGQYPVPQEMYGDRSGPYELSSAGHEPV